MPDNVCLTVEQYATLKELVRVAGIYNVVRELRRICWDKYTSLETVIEQL